MTGPPPDEALLRWRRYGPHRAAIAACIGHLARPSDGRLAFLGAGPCFDIDLRGLTAEFAAITLVDLDGAALAAGAAFQLPGGAPNLHLRGGVDLGGLASGAPPTAAERRARLRAHRATVAEAPQDGVISLTLLSQLMLQAVDGLAPDDPGLPALVAEVRLSHWRLMLQALRPGGWALLVTDVVASDSLPELLHPAGPGQIGRLLAAARATRNHFIGLDPDRIPPAPGKDPWLDREMADIALAPPWIWHDAVDHARLVVAIRARRAG